MSRSAISLQEAKNRFLEAPAAAPQVRFDPAVQFLPPLPSDAKRRELALIAASSTSMLSALSGSSASDLQPKPTNVAGAVPLVIESATGTTQQQQQLLATMLQLRRDVQQQTLELYMAMGNRSRFLFHNLFPDSDLGGIGPSRNHEGDAVSGELFDEMVSEVVAAKRPAGESIALRDRDFLISKMPPPPPIDVMLRDQEEYEADRQAEEQRERERAEVDDTIRHVAFQNQHRFLFNANQEAAGGGADAEPQQRKPRPSAAPRGVASSSSDPVRVLMNVNVDDDMHRLLEVETIDCQVLLSYIMQAAAVYNNHEELAPREESSESTPSITPIQSVVHGMSQLASAIHVPGQVPSGLGQQTSAATAFPSQRHQGHSATSGSRQVGSSSNAKQQQQPGDETSSDFPFSSAQATQQQHQQQRVNQEVRHPHELPPPVAVVVRPPAQSAVTSLSSSNTTHGSNKISPQGNGKQKGNVGWHNKSGNTTTSSGSASVIQQSPVPVVPCQSTTFVDLADSAAAASVLQANQPSNSSGHDTSTQRTGKVTRASKRSSRSGSKKTSSGGLFSCFRRTDPSSSSSSSSSSSDDDAAPAATAGEQRPHWV